MEDPTAPAAAPWYRSVILRAALVVVATRIIARFHFNVDVQDAVNTALDIADLAAAAVAAYARFKHPLPVLTLTKARAAAVVASMAPKYPLPPAAVPAVPLGPPKLFVVKIPEK